MVTIHVGGDDTVPPAQGHVGRHALRIRELGRRRGADQVERVFRHVREALFAMIQGQHREGLRRVVRRRKREILARKSSAAVIPQHVEMAVVCVGSTGQQRRSGPPFGSSWSNVTANIWGSGHGGSMITGSRAASDPRWSRPINNRPQWLPPSAGIAKIASSCPSWSRSAEVLATLAAKFRLSSVNSAGFKRGSSPVKQASRRANPVL